MIPFDTLYRDFPPSWRRWRRYINFALPLLAWCGVIAGGYLMLEWAMETM